MNDKNKSTIRIKPETVYGADFSGNPCPLCGSLLRNLWNMEIGLYSEECKNCIESLKKLESICEE